MKARDLAKQAAIISYFKSDWQIYCKLRNVVTNKKKNKLYYNNKKIAEIKHDSKQLWNTLNNTLGGNTFLFRK